MKYKTRDMNWFSLEPFTYNDMQNVWLDADREEGRSEQEPHRRKVDQYGKTGLGFPEQRSRKCWQESGLGNNIQQARWRI